MVDIIRATGVRFAIRSGGHNINKDWSNVDRSGVLIDMTKFNQVDLSEDKKLVTIGAGVAWGDAYKKLEGSGVSVNGGRHTLPNAAGQTLGGQSDLVLHSKLF